MKIVGKIQINTHKNFLKPSYHLGSFPNQFKKLAGFNHFGGTIIVVSMLTARRKCEKMTGKKGIELTYKDRARILWMKKK